MVFKTQQKTFSPGQSAERNTHYWAIGWTAEQARAAASGNAAGHPVGKASPRDAHRL